MEKYNFTSQDKSLEFYDDYIYDHENDIKYKYSDIHSIKNSFQVIALIMCILTALLLARFYENLIAAIVFFVLTIFFMRLIFAYFLVFKGAVDNKIIITISNKKKIRTKLNEILKKNNLKIHKKTKRVVAID